MAEAKDAAPYELLKSINRRYCWQMGQNSWLPPCEVDNPRRMRSNFCSRRYFDQYTRYAKQPWRMKTGAQELLVHSPKARVKDSVWSEFVQIIRRRLCNEVAPESRMRFCAQGRRHLKSGSRKAHVARDEDMATFERFSAMLQFL